MTSTTKVYNDGNRVTVPADEVVALQDGEQGWLYDADGNELRVGDRALVLAGLDDWPGNWIGAVVKIDRVGPTYLYEGGRQVNGIFWPASPHESAGVTRLTYPGRSSWGIKPPYLRKINMNTEEGLRLMLGSLYQQRAAIDEAAARVEADRIKVSLEIRRTREDLGEIG